MPKHKEYKLKEYEKAVEILAAQKGVRVKIFLGSKNAIRFEVFVEKEASPRAMWTIHTNHNKTRTVWSKDDYKKPDLNLSAEKGTFLAILGEL